MTADKFWKKFKEKMNKKSVRDKAISTWNNRGNFTNFIIDQIADIVSEEHNTSKEYYNIDLIGWSQLKQNLPTPLVSKYRLKKHLWSLDIAIEHENDQSDWTDELIKLLYINCPLRVVIGYIPSEVTSDNAKMKNILNYASESIRLAEGESDLISGKQEYILIFGKNSGQITDFSENTYSAYKYNVVTKKFEYFEESST